MCPWIVHTLEMVKCCLHSLHLQKRAGLLHGSNQPVEWRHQKTLREVWRNGSGRVVVDMLLGLHHRCQVQQRGVSNDLLGVPSDLKSSQDGAEGRGVAWVPTSVVWSGS